MHSLKWLFEICCLLGLIRHSTRGRPDPLALTLYWDIEGCSLTPQRAIVPEPDPWVIPVLKLSCLHLLDPVQMLVQDERAYCERQTNSSKCDTRLWLQA